MQMMEENDRNLILNNIDELVRVTEFKLLIEKCQKKFLSNIMVQNIIDNNDDETERHKNLLIKITQRGPTAFADFKGICEVYFPEAAEILKQSASVVNNNTFLSISTAKKENELERRETHEGWKNFISKVKPSCGANSSNAMESNENIRLEPYNGPIQITQKVILSKKFFVSPIPHIETYHMKSKNRGVLFCVNIIDFIDKEKRRNGAEEDKKRLLDLFNQMGFKLYYYENITSEHLWTLIKQLSSSDAVRTADCMVFALLTHGSLASQTTYVDFSDGSYTTTEEIVQKFSNSSCKYLQGKPKIFLFPFCRGLISDKGLKIESPKSVTEHDCSPFVHREMKIPTLSDIAICYATVPGFRAHRDPTDGTWYIKGLYRVFAKYAHNTNFEYLMKYLDSEIREANEKSELMQTSSVEYRGFNKDLYFNPGFYGAENDQNGNEYINTLTDNTNQISI